MNKYFYSVKQLLEKSWLTIIILLFFLAFGSFNMNAQVSVVGTTAGTTSVNYTTLNAAFGAINAGTHKGAISVTITGNTTEPATAIPLLKSASPSSYTSILIKPSGGDFTINSAASPTANKGIIILQGADNVTIDGDDPATAGNRNLSIVVALNTSTGTAAIQLASNSTTGLDGADSNIIKNCNIRGGRSDLTSLSSSYGIVMSDISSIITGASSSLNTVIQNNLITRCDYGIFADGASVTYPNTGTQITDNTIGSATSAESISYRGIYIDFSNSTSGQAALIEGNDIQVGNPVAGVSDAIAGLEIASSNYGIKILRNNIHDIYHPSLGVYGIFVSTAQTLGYIQNNIIRDISTGYIGNSQNPKGIYLISSAPLYNIDYNTVVLTVNLSNSATSLSYCAFLQPSLSSLRNNNFVNKISSSNAAIFYFALSNSTFNNASGEIDYNNYYNPNGAFCFYASGTSTLSQWKSKTAKDANSKILNPPFVSATDLHILYNGTNAAAFNGSGTPIAGVTTDFDKHARNSNNPDIGADEFSLNPITSFSPTTLCAQGGQTVTITGTNFSQITAVKFNGVNATSFTIVNSTTITAVFPVGATGGFITIVNGSDFITSTTAYTVNPLVIPSITIASNPSNNITTGTSVTFTATTTNGGTAPFYQWKKNGNNVGANSNTYSDSAVANGDIITCVLTSNDPCASPITTTSSAITVAVSNPCAAGTTWTSRTSAANNEWRCVTYGNGLYVAVAQTGTNRVMTSPDGINWTSRTAAANNNWTSVTYGNGLFVAVALSGTGNRVMTSPNGTTWTIRTSAADNNWNSVTYGNGLFVAVADWNSSSPGAGNQVMTSNDGLTWTSRSAAANNPWQSVTYGNGLFVAVAKTGVGTGNLVMTSPDGINWTSRTSAADNYWVSVTYGNGLFVAVAASGSGNRVMTSPDGINWTSQSSAANNQWWSITYGDGVFVAIANNGTGNRVMTSTDGFNWTSRTSAVDNSWYSVTYGNGLFVSVAVTGSGNRVMTSAASLVTPTFSQVAPICSGTTIAPLPTTSTNGITGTWSPALNNTTTTTYTFTPTAGLCANTTIMTIVVIESPALATISLFVNQANGCSPLTTQWNFTVPPNNADGTTYTINWGDGSANETYTHPVAINTLTHIYNISSCGTNVILGNITYYNAFQPTVATQNICSPISGLSGFGLITVGKSPTANFSSSLTVGSTNQSVQLSNTSDFGLTISATNGSCSATAPFYWTITPSTPGSYTATGLGSNNGNSNSSLWTIGSMTPSIIFHIPGTYTIALRVKNSCGDSTVTKTICIEAPLVPQFTLNSTQSCSPAAISSTNTTNLSYSCNPPTYLWDVQYTAGYCGSATPTWSYTSGSSTTANPSFNFVTPGTYNIKVTMTNSAGSVTSAIQTVIVKQPPVVLINSATPTTCQIANYTAVVNGCAPSTNPLVFSWSFPGGIPAVSSLITPSTISYSTAGLKTVTLAVTNECGTTTDSKTFTINPSALPTISGSLTACQSATSQLTGSATASTTNPWLSSNVGIATVNATGLVTAVAPGTTTITYTTNNGCAATAVFTVNPTVTPTFTQVAAVCSGTTIAALPTTSTNAVIGTWSPVLNNTTTTTYTFTPSTGQCANTTTQTITVASPSVTSAISFVAPVAALPSVTISTQIWTNKNLDVETYRDGTPIPQVTDPTAWANLTTGAWCYYNNDPANGAIYGKLYNWYAVAGIHDNDPNTPNKILSPLGWHVPSDGEWTTLTDYLGGESVAGGKMKETGTAHWNSPNTSATNSSGFTGLPGGCRYSRGAFDFIGDGVDWWSSSEYDTTVWVRFLNSATGNAIIRSYFGGKLYGFSVRLVKD